MASRENIMSTYGNGNDNFNSRALHRHLAQQSKRTSFQLGSWVHITQASSASAPHAQAFMKGGPFEVIGIVPGEGENHYHLDIRGAVAGWYNTDLFYECRLVLATEGQPKPARTPLKYCGYQPPRAPHVTAAYRWGDGTPTTIPVSPAGGWSLDADSNFKNLPDDYSGFGIYHEYSDLVQDWYRPSPRGVDVLADGEGLATTTSAPPCPPAPRESIDTKLVDIRGLQDSSLVKESTLAASRSSGAEEQCPETWWPTRCRAWVRDLFAAKQGPNFAGPKDELIEEDWEEVDVSELLP